MTYRLGVVLSVLALGSSPLGAEQWPQWRGPTLNGVSGERNLPARWSTTENVAWKLQVPERSGSTPIVWGDHVFLNVGDGSTLSLWAVDRSSGAVRWKRALGGGNQDSRIAVEIRGDDLSDAKRIALDEIDPREPVVRVTLSMEYRSRKATRRNLGEIPRCSRGGDSQDIGERRDTPGCGWVAHRGA